MMTWLENGQTHTARWRSENGSKPPNRVVIADDTMTAEAAYRLACEGTALLWRGDFQNARQLLQALTRLLDRKAAQASKPSKSARALASPKRVAAPLSASDQFHQHRLAQSQRARLLGMILLPFAANHVVPLRRAPDVQLACVEAYGAAGANDVDYVASMRELLGLIGAHEWRKNGVEIPALGARIYPHYGVFSPVRGEYVKLVAEALFSSAPPKLAFDIGSGTGVLAAVLAKRGVARVVATDQDDRALACARDNMARLGLAKCVEVVKADLFPDVEKVGRAALIVCNPPWLPAKANSPLDHAIYDPESRMLLGFLAGLPAHLAPNGEGWLILSDFAEHLGLRSRAELLAAIESAGLKVLARIDVRPEHSKVGDAQDPLHTARAAEVTSLWRLVVK